MAESMIQTSELDQTPDYDASEAFNLVKIHVAVAKSLFTLGRPSKLTELAIQSNLGVQHVPSRVNYLLRLVGFLLQAQSFWASKLSAHERSEVWHSDSVRRR